MYEKRQRPKKKVAQDKISNWLSKQCKVCPSLSKGRAITLCGSDVNNAIQSLRGTNPIAIDLYDIDKNCISNAKEDMLENGHELINEHYNSFLLKNYYNNTKYVFLQNNNIHHKIHTGVNCFYYDFCSSYKNVNWDHIYKEFENQIALKQSFTVVFTLSLRGKDCSKKNTHEAVNSFINRFNGYKNYNIQKMKSCISYNGADVGAPMYTYAVAFMNKEHIQNIERKTKMTKEEKTIINSMEEMAYTLAKTIDRSYTNKDIANLTGISINKIRAWAAWNTGKLMAKKKKK